MDILIRKHIAKEVLLFWDHIGMIHNRLKIFHFLFEIQKAYWNQLKSLNLISTYSWQLTEIPQTVTSNCRLHSLFGPLIGLSTTQFITIMPLYEITKASLLHSNPITHCTYDVPTLCFSHPASPVRAATQSPLLVFTISFQMTSFHICQPSGPFFYFS